MPGDQMPIVSVCIQTYQHSAYIRECLDSVMMQKTDFPFEVIIGDDDSTDGTREICISYSKNYPDRIRLFLRNEKDKIFINGEKTGRYNLIHNLKAALGKYIALLDGDDYWSDKLKLQKQVDFLEEHPSYNICFCGVSRLLKNKFYPHRAVKKEAREFTVADLAANCFIQPCSSMFRNPGFAVIPDHFYKVPVLDYCLFLQAAAQGNIFYMETPMAVYRQHETGLWGGSNKETQLLRLWRFLDIMIPLHKNDTGEILRKQRNWRIRQLIRWHIEQKQWEKLSNLVKNLSESQTDIEVNYLGGYIAANKLRYILKRLFKRKIRV